MLFRCNVEEHFCQIDLLCWKQDVVPTDYIKQSFDASHLVASLPTTCPFKASTHTKHALAGDGWGQPVLGYLLAALLSALVVLAVQRLLAIIRGRRGNASQKRGAAGLIQR